MVEFNLSEKIRIFKQGEEIWTDGTTEIVLTEDVKEFIRILKEKIYFVRDREKRAEIIDALAGKTLCKK